MSGGGKEERVCDEDLFLCRSGGRWGERVRTMKNIYGDQKGRGGVGM